MRARVAAAVVMVCGATTIAPAQRFSSSVEAVRVDVLVTNRGVPVSGLRSADFEVRDNGVVQRIELLGFEQLPVNVVMTLDLSSSVDGARLRDLRAAGRALLKGLQPDERAALVTFNHVVARRQSLTTDHQRVIDALESAEPAGNTSLLDAAYAAMIVADSEASRSLVVAFSDGVDVSSWLSPQLVLDAAKRIDAVVYGVSMRGSRPRFLEDLTEQTGGRLLDVESRNLSETFVGILNEFRSRYVLSYTPQGVKPGGWHQLDVRVKGRRATVKARPGYLAGR